MGAGSIVIGGLEKGQGGLVRGIRDDECAGLFDDTESVWNRE